MDDVENKSTEVEKRPEPEGPDRVKFLYNRSNYYREILADGIYGGVTPSIDIHMSFYNQHFGDILEQVYELTPDRTLGAELKKVFTGGQIAGSEQIITRETEVGITISVPTAISLIRWLTAQVKEANSRMGFEEPKEEEQDAE